MRCTTELTARFELNTLDAHVYMVETRLEEGHEPEDLFGEMTVEIEEGNHFDDALDMLTVPFESVEEELSIELFEQDAAEDRERDYDVCKCKKCGLEDEWDDGHLTFIAGEYRCAKCMPKGHGEITIMEELYRKRQMREQNKRADRAVKFRAALEVARKLRPDLNWARYEYDPRRYA